MVDGVNYGTYACKFAGQSSLRSYLLVPSIWGQIVAWPTRRAMLDNANENEDISRTLCAPEQVNSSVE